MKVVEGALEKNTLWIIDLMKCTGFMSHKGILDVVFILR